MKDTSERHQEEVSKLQEKIGQLVRADAHRPEFSRSLRKVLAQRCWVLELPFRFTPHARRGRVRRLCAREQQPDGTCLVLYRRRTSRRPKLRSTKPGPLESKRLPAPYRSTRRSYRSFRVRWNQHNSSAAFLRRSARNSERRWRSWRPLKKRPRYGRIGILARCDEQCSDVY